MSDLILHETNVEGMCIKAANAHKRNGLQFDDLLQQARMGAVIAAQSFDPSKGAKFSTHAYMSIRAYCQQAVQANRPASGTSKVAKTLFYKLPAIQRELATQGKPVNAESIAAHIGETVEKVRDALQVVKQGAVSTSKPTGEEEKSTFGDTLVSRQMNQHEKLVRTRRAEAVRDAMSTFLVSFLPSKQERAQGKYLAVFNGRLLTLLNGEDTLTLEEVANSLDTSKQRVAQIETELKAALKSHMTANL